MATGRTVSQRADVPFSGSQLRAGVRATYCAFVASGAAFASWAARIPQIRDRLALSPADLGLVLLAGAAGSVIALPMSGAIIVRFGSRRTVTWMSVLLAAAMVDIAVGSRAGVLPLVIGLFFFGFGMGAWDVAMNVQGAEVERHLGRAIMARFHAGFSLGTVAGAGVSTVMIGLHVSVTAHLIAVAVAVAIVVPATSRRFLPDAEAPERHDGPAPGALARWREPRTLLIGLCVLAFAFTEGSANDWISVALIDGYRAPAAVGALGFGLFLTGMTGARWFGHHLLDRYGRVAVVRGLAVVSLLGLVLFVFAPSAVWAFPGAALWGIGASLGFPVGMSAASDDPAASASRVSVIASIGYCAFLGGPPLIGFLGSRFGTLHALLAVAVLLAVATLLAGALRPLEARSARAAAEVSPPG
jgi:fucose permease